MNAGKALPTVPDRCGDRKSRKRGSAPLRRSDPQRAASATLPDDRFDLPRGGQGGGRFGDEGITRPSAIVLQSLRRERHRRLDRRPGERCGYFALVRLLPRRTSA